MTEGARQVAFGVVHGIIVAVLLMVSLAFPATAHDSVYWFNPLRWDNLDVDYKIDDSIPGIGGSNLEDRIHDAVVRWNSQCCIGTFAFDDVGNGDHDWVDPCAWSTDPTDVWVFHHGGIGGAIAETSRCEVLNQQQQITTIRSVRLTFGAIDPFVWYTGQAEEPNFGDEYSVEEAALHELGHVTGTFRGGNADEGNSGGHWPYPSGVCAQFGAEADRTMCPFAEVGESNLIPLEPHDIDTFQDWY